VLDSLSIGDEPYARAISRAHEKEQAGEGGYGRGSKVQEQRARQYYDTNFSHIHSKWTAGKGGGRRGRGEVLKMRHLFY
jgi:hypothetical protein